MKRRRSNSSSSSSGGNDAAPGSLQPQSCRPDFGELLHLLGTAAEGNRSDEIEALAAKGVELSASSGIAGLSALHRATLTGSMDALRTLLRAGADPDASETGARRTPLHFAALRSDVAAVGALVKAGADKEARDSDGRTPLHLSCIVMRPSDPAVPLYLLEAGALGSAADAQGTTALDIAVRYGCAAVVQAIFRPQRKTAGAAAARPRPSCGSMGLLYEAVRGGDASIVGALVEAGWEAGVSPAPCPSPSEAAKSDEKCPCLPMLPPPPAPPTTPLQDTRASKSSGGNLPAPSACLGKRKRPAADAHAPAVAAALEHTAPRDPPPSTVGVVSGASAAPAAADSHGGDAPPQVTEARETLSPLMLAADSGRPDVVRALLGGRQRGFPDAGDTQGYTALHFATMRGSVGIAEALLGVENRLKNNHNGGRGGGGSADVDLAAEGGADPDIKNADGDTALHIAVATRRTNVGEVLLRAGASVKVANRLGHTALHFAAALGLSGFAKRLLDCGADVAAVDGLRSGKATSPRKALGAGKDDGFVKAKDTAVKTATAAAVPARLLRGTTAAAVSPASAGALAPQQQDTDKRRSTRVCAAARATAPQQQDANSSRPTRVCVLRANGTVSPTAACTPLASLNAKSRPTSGSSPKMRVSPMAKPSTPATPGPKTPAAPGLRSSPRIRGTPPSTPENSPRSASKSSSRPTPKSSPRPNPKSNGNSANRGGGGKTGGRGGGGGSTIAVKDRKPKKEGRTPLHYAAMNGRVQTTRVLLEAGAPPAHRWNDKRESPLLVAARNGHADVVALLLERLGPADVNMPAVEGETPLSVACANGHADVIEKLLRKGADVSRRDPASHQSSLDLAVSGTACCPSNRSRIVKTLLASKADPNGGGGGSVLGHSTPLHTACRVGGTVGVDVVEALLEGGADPDAPPPGEGGRRLLRPLHIAAVHGNADAVSALTLRGCWLDVKTLDPSRSTPLVLAVQQGHVGAASALIEAGAAIDVVPRREDGSEKASSLTRLAADMKRGDMVSLLAKAVVQRDSSDAWVKEWAAANGTVAGAAASAPDLGGGGADGAGGVDSAGGVDNGEDTADCVESIDGVDNAAGVDIAGGVDRAADGDGASGVDGAGGADGAPGANGSTGVSSIGVTFRPRR